MSLITYCAGSPAPAPPPARRRVEAFDRLLDNLVAQGGFALRQLEREQSRTSREVRALLDAGMIEQSPDGRLRVTPKALRQAEERLLVDLLRRGGAGYAFGKHQSGASADFAAAGDEPRPHRPGDPLAMVDVGEALRNALARGTPLNLHEDDIVVRPGLASGRCSTVILLDLSGSMARYGKFVAARRAALALRALVRQRFPGDELYSAGFATRAEPLPGAALLEARPRDVGLFDPRAAEQRVAASAPDVPGHFTNIQAGLRLARRRLRRGANLGKQVFLITAGEPTAHLDGDELVLSYPPTAATARQTLLVAARCAAEGVAVHVFGLIGEFSPPGLRTFVDQLARAGRGGAACCPPRQLGTRLLDSFTRSRPARG